MSRPVQIGSREPEASKANQSEGGGMARQGFGWEFRACERDRHDGAADVREEPATAGLFVLSSFASDAKPSHPPP